MAVYTVTQSPHVVTHNCQHEQDTEQFLPPKRCPSAPAGGALTHLHPRATTGLLPITATLHFLEVHKNGKDITLVGRLLISFT